MEEPRRRLFLVVQAPHDSLSLDKHGRGAAIVVTAPIGTDQEAHRKKVAIAPDQFVRLKRDDLAISSSIDSRDMVVTVLLGLAKQNGADIEPVASQRHVQRETSAADDRMTLHHSDTLAVEGGTVHNARSRDRPGTEDGRRTVWSMLSDRVDGLTREEREID